MRRRRLVHVTTTAMSLDWLLGPQLHAFANSGYEVIGVSAVDEHVAAVEAAGVRHIELRHATRAPSVGSDTKLLAELHTVFKDLRPHIVHTHNPKPGVLGRIAARAARVPVIVNTQHGLYAQPTDRWQRRYPVYALERVAAACSDLELVQNPEDADTLRRTLRVPARKVEVLGNGIDLVRFRPERGAPGRAFLRTTWDVRPGDVVCGVVGRLVREKGIVEILDAARRLAATDVAVRFVVIGPLEPDKPDAIDRATIAAAEADGVVFAGRRDDMPECYAAMDLFVTASHREGFPRAAMEASAMGLPVVATDIRGCRQVVDDGRTGVLVPVGDAAALAHAIAGLVADPTRLAVMGVAARSKALAEFDQQRQIERTLAAYSRLSRTSVG
jgi:glycosyltransferase involved in cell wall biosynthesis